MSTTRRGPGHEHDHPILTSSRPEPAGQSCCGPTIATDGSGLSGISRDGGEQLHHRRAPPRRDRTRARLGADRRGGVAAGADRRRRAVRLVQRPVRLHLHRPPPGRGQRDRGAAAGPADDRVHAARARPVPGGQVRPGRTDPDPGLRRRVRLHERGRRRRGQPAVGRRVRDRAGRAGRGGGPGRGGDPPPRPGRPGTLGLEHCWPRRGGCGQDRRAGAAVLSAIRPGRAGDGPRATPDGAGRHSPACAS